MSANSHSMPDRSCRQQGICRHDLFEESAIARRARAIGPYDGVVAVLFHQATVGI
jgi:hypothetical protein